MVEQLSQPAYQHILLNHLPIIGTVMGLVGLGVAATLRQRAAFITAFVILLVAGVSAWPVHETGSAAYKAVRRISDDAGIDWLDVHMDRADKGIWGFYGMAVAAALAIILPFKWPKMAMALSIVTALMAIMCLVVGAWIAEAGGRVRHPEFRPVIAVPAEAASGRSPRRSARKKSGRIGAE